MEHIYGVQIRRQIFQYIFPSTIDHIYIQYAQVRSKENMLNI